MLKIILQINYRISIPHSTNKYVYIWELSTIIMAGLISELGTTFEKASKTPYIPFVLCLFVLGLRKYVWYELLYGLCLLRKKDITVFVFNLFVSFPVWYDIDFFLGIHCKWSYTFWCHFSAGIPFTSCQMLMAIARRNVINFLLNTLSIRKQIKQVVW